MIRSSTAAGALEKLTSRKMRGKTEDETLNALTCRIFTHGPTLGSIPHQESSIIFRRQTLGLPFLDRQVGEIYKCISPMAMLLLTRCW